MIVGATWALAQPGAPEPDLPTQPLDASPRELRVLGGRTDYSIVTPKRASPQELPTWRIPNMPSSAEAYYAPDNYHVIAQARDPDAVRAPGRSSGALTWIFSDDGKTKWRVNDRGQDACSYFFPDGKRVIFTSTRDNMDFPIGNWSDQNSYPQGAELYIADIDGGNRQRLTNNAFYDAEVSVSPDGKKIVFSPPGRRRARPLYDECGRHRREEAHRYAGLAGGRAVLLAGFKDHHHARLEPRHLWQETSYPDDDLYDQYRDRRTHPAHPRRLDELGALSGAGWTALCVCASACDNPSNWEIFLGDLEGGEPVRLTFNDSFDGFPSISPDGTKMLFSRSEGPGFMSGLYTYVMDISSLNIGPKPKP